MHKNIGIADMCIRLCIGAAFLAVGLLDNPIISAGLPKTIIAVMGGIVTTSALFRNCPLYYLAGINTTGNNHK